MYKILNFLKPSPITAPIKAEPMNTETPVSFKPAARISIISIVNSVDRLEQLLKEKRTRLGSREIENEHVISIDKHDQSINWNFEDASAKTGMCNAVKNFDEKEAATFTNNGKQLDDSTI